MIDTFLQLQALYGRVFELPSINWNLQGRCAGKAYPSENRINLNSTLLINNTDDFIEQTVPHEIAHLINRTLNGPQVRPHGPEWKAIMRALGLPPLRCHNYAVNQTGTRWRKRTMYFCACDFHFVSQIVHNRICRGQIYRCRHCGLPLTTNRPQERMN